jgi:hypothetical protein
MLMLALLTWVLIVIFPVFGIAAFQLALATQNSLHSL